MINPGISKNESLKRLSKLIGEFIQYWGFKSIHGEIWTYMYLSKDPLDAGQISEYCEISKSLVSQSLQELEKYNVIICLGLNAFRRKAYTANPEVTKVIWGVIKQREKKLLTEIYQAYQLVKELDKNQLLDQGLSLRKLDKMGRMINFAHRYLKTLLAFEKLDMTDWKKYFD